MPTTKIHVTAADNELLLIASTPAGSSQLLHYKSGFNKPVDVNVFPGAILATGSYDLTMIGVNWGGPINFTVTVTTDGHPQIFQSNASTTHGNVWSQTLQINVVSGQ